MSHIISLQEAIAMTDRYRQNRETIIDSQYQNQNILASSESFDRAPFDSLLEQDGCTGLRIYYGMDENLKVHAIIVGVNENDEDMVSASASLLNDPEDILIDKGVRCPEICPPESPLNS